MAPNPASRSLSVASPDLSARVRAAQVGLRARLRRRETLELLVKQAYSESEPSRIAEALLEQVETWLPATLWQAFSIDETGTLTLLASRGETPDGALDPTPVASWIAQHETVFLSSNLARDARVEGGAPTAVIGFPMCSRGRTVGALVCCDGSPCASPIKFGAGVLPLLQSQFDMVALALEQALRMRKTEALSVTDDLTGLYNSRYLREALHRETKRAVRYGRPLSVLFVDLDGFKAVNDTHGHLCGSRTIAEAAAVIYSCARDSDVVARYGGDEFVVVLPDTPVDGALVVARRIRERLAARVFLAADGLDVRLTASVGIAVLPEAGVEAETLLQAADRAMYRVKGSGKDNILVASPG